MSPVRLAIIGAGGIGSRHLQLAQHESACEVVAVADPAPSARANTGSTNVPYFADYEHMLTTVSPEAVIVAVPTCTGRSARRAPNTVPTS